MSKVKKLPITDKTYLTPAQYKKLKGSIEAHAYEYWPEKKVWRKKLKRIRGIAAARRKAPVFILATKVGKTGIMFLNNEAKLTHNRKEAMKFYSGYDDPEVKKEFWKEKTDLTFFTCRL